MLDALLTLPDHLRKRLVAGLAAGLVRPPYAPATVRSFLGSEVAAEVGSALQRLDRAGVPPYALSSLIQSVERVESSICVPQLVWSGPEVPAVGTRSAPKPTVPPAVSRLCG